MTLPAAQLALPDATEIADLVELARRLAVEAGRHAVDGRPDRLQVDTKTSPTDVVTQMDRAVEDLLRRGIREHRPHDGVLGEEDGLGEAGQSSSGVPDGNGTAGDVRLTWVVDPIDGTVNYLYDIGVFAVSVAVVVGDPTVPGAWQPVAGVVVNPVNGQVYVAGLGQGATLDDRPLRLAEPPELGRALVATGFGYTVARRRHQARVIGELLPEVRDLRRIGSAALDLCMVASGKVDAYFERGLNPWDLAAAQLVVTEAGGAVRGLGDAPPSNDMVVAAAAPLVHTLAARLEQLDAARDAED